jgi:LacI family transcriptional regulator
MITKRATIDDVARLAGVSIKTVSRVLNREPNVRPSTQEKVVAAAEMLNYRPNLSARQLAGNRTFVIGMLYDNPNADYVTDMQYGSLETCREHGYDLLIHPCQASSSDVTQEAVGLETRVDGLILLQPLSDNESLCRLLLEKKVPSLSARSRGAPGSRWVIRRRRIK